jgi:hypothetical protein
MISFSAVHLTSDTWCSRSHIMENEITWCGSTNNILSLFPMLKHMQMYSYEGIYLLSWHKVKNAVAFKIHNM